MPVSPLVEAVYRRGSPRSLSAVLYGGPLAGEKHIARSDAGAGISLASRPASPGFSCSGGPLLVTVWRIVWYGRSFLPFLRGPTVCRAFLFRYTRGSQYRGTLQTPRFFRRVARVTPFLSDRLLTVLQMQKLQKQLIQADLSLGCFAVDGDHGWHGNSPVRLNALQIRVTA